MSSTQRSQEETYHAQVGMVLLQIVSQGALKRLWEALPFRVDGKGSEE